MGGVRDAAAPRRSRFAESRSLLAQNSPDLLPEFDENGPFCCVRFPSDLPRLNGCLHDQGKRRDCFSARPCRGSSLENTARKKAPFRCEVEFGAASSVPRAPLFRSPPSLMPRLFHVKQLSQCSAISEQMFHVKHVQEGIRKRQKRGGSARPKRSRKPSRTYPAHARTSRQNANRAPAQAARHPDTSHTPAANGMPKPPQATRPRNLHATSRKPRAAPTHAAP